MMFGILFRLKPAEIFIELYLNTILYHFIQISVELIVQFDDSCLNN